MARCAGAGVRQLSIAALILVVPLVANAQVPAGSAGDPRDVPKAESKPPARSKTVPAQPEDAPDAALIEYLGEYGDAADGLDPIGLDDPESPPVDLAAQKRGSGG